MTRKCEQERTAAVQAGGINTKSLVLVPHAVARSVQARYGGGLNANHGFPYLDDGKC